MRLTHYLNILLGALVFMLPWQVVWIAQELWKFDSKWEYATRQWYVTEILIWISASLFLIWYWRVSSFARRQAAVNWRKRNIRAFITSDRIFALACGLFVLYMYIFGWTGGDSLVFDAIGFQHQRYIAEAFLVFFMIFIGPLGSRKTIGLLCVGAAAPIVLGLVQFFAQTTWSSSVLGLAEHPASQAGTSIVSVSGARWLRAYGSFAHPNVFGGYALAVIGLILSLIARKDFSENTRTTYAYVIMLSVSAAGLFVSFSRSAWMGFALICVGLSVYALRYRRFVLFRRIGYAVTIFVAMALVYAPLVQARFTVRTVHEKQSISERVAGYRESVEMIREHIWTGTGAGAYTFVLSDTYQELAGWQLQPVHNTILLILAESGVIGAVLLGIAGTALSVMLVRPGRKIQGFHSGVWIWLIVLCSFAPIVLFDHYLWSQYTGLILGAIVAAVVSRSALNMSTGHPLSVHSR